jgi:hypothetical protein
VERRHRGTAQPGFTCHSADRPGRARVKVGRGVSPRALRAGPVVVGVRLCRRHYPTRRRAHVPHGLQLARSHRDLVAGGAVRRRCGSDDRRGRRNPRGAPASGPPGTGRR